MGSLSTPRVPPALSRKLSCFQKNKTKEEYEMRVKIVKIYRLIMEGAQQFLWAEYKYLGIFLILFGLILLIVIGLTTGKWDNAGFTLMCFFLGAGASISSGVIGMLIATYSNARTTLKSRKSLKEGFDVAISIFLYDGNIFLKI